jgi:hypothetical protein
MAIPCNIIHSVKAGEPRDYEKRIRLYFDEGDRDMCWPWKGHLSKPPRSRRGYGHIRRNGIKIKAHTAVYELLIGPKPTGDLEPDHTCQSENCVNPFHLEWVSHRENVLRGSSLAARRAKVTHCPQGHEYTEENTYLYITADGERRYCRTCLRERSLAAWKMRQKQGLKL